MVEEASHNIKQEIAALEEILREKKRELEAKGESKEEKELLKEAVREHVERAAEAPLASSGVEGPAPDAQSPSPLMPSQPVQPQQADDPLAGLDHREQIEELVAFAFSKGIVEAVNVARRANNPHLLDEFHDALVDRLYEYLIQEGVIKSS